jgi:hypothetical protein
MLGNGSAPIPVIRPTPFRLDRQARSVPVVAVSDRREELGESNYQERPKGRLGFPMEQRTLHRALFYKGLAEFRGVNLGEENRPKWRLEI